MLAQRSLLLVLALCATACNPPPPPTPPAPPPPPKPDLKAEEASLRQLDKALVAAVAAKNIDAVAGFYSSDAVFLEPNEEPKTGEALKASWTGLFGLPDVVLNFEATSIGVSADATLAYDVGGYTLSFTGPKGKIEDHGSYVEVWRRIGGHWKIVVDTHNSSVPLPAEPAKK